MNEERKGERRERSRRRGKGKRFQYGPLQGKIKTNAIRREKKEKHVHNLSSTEEKGREKKKRGGLTLYISFISLTRKEDKSD